MAIPRLCRVRTAGYPGVVRSRSCVGLIAAWLFVAASYLSAQPVDQAGRPYDHAPRLARPALPIDLDGNGLPELVIPSHVYDLLAFTAQGTVVSGWNDPNPDWTTYVVRVGDFDGDGVRELLYPWSNSLLALGFCDLSGNVLPWPWIEPEGHFAGGTMEKVIVADLDLDGRAEIICNGRYVTWNDTIHVVDYQGNAWPGWPKTFNAKVKLAVEDLDGDGAKEIVVAGRDTCFCGAPSPTFVYRADGTLMPGWPVIPTGGLWPFLWWTAVADLDGDGTREIIGTSAYDVYTLRADGTQFRPRHFVDGILREIGVADLDSDGRKEIVVPGIDLNVVDYDLGVVATTQGSGYGYSGFDGVSVADIDGDGFAEIGAFSIWPTAVHLFDRHLNPLPGWPVPVSSQQTDQQSKTLMMDLDGDNDIEFIYAKVTMTHVYDLPNATGNPPRVLWQGWYNDVNGSSSYHVRDVPMGQRFMRGDADANGAFDLADCVFALNSLFVAGSAQPTCQKALDFNDDGSVNLQDPIHGLGALFLGTDGPTPGCRVDITVDSLDCAQHAACP